MTIISISPAAIWAAPLSLYSRALIYQVLGAHNWDAVDEVSELIGIHWRDVVRAFWPCKGHVFLADGTPALRFVSPCDETCTFSE